MTAAAPGESQPRRRVLVGVGGGIAAYKTCSLIRKLHEAGHDVHVIPTENALQFVGKATFEALSGNPVATDVFSNVPEVPHVRLGRFADLLIVAPATADVLARAAHGRADDLLTATLLTMHSSVVFAPAMHTEMWQHPATVENVATLRRRGAMVLEPASGRLTGADSGPGRMAEPEELAQLVELVLDRPDAMPRDLAGLRLLISAGGTREPLDPVRFLGNRSSGKQGFALAQLAAQRGAHVTLVAGHTSGVIPPAAVDLVHVSTALELRDAMTKYAAEADVVVMAAAVADFRPAHLAVAKIKKDGSEPSAIELVQNPDILAGLVQARRDGTLPASTTIVGFAAETGDEHHDVLHYAREKLTRKGADLLVVNTVDEGRAFEVDVNEGWILGADGSQVALEHGSKSLMSSRILDAITRLRSA